MWKNDWSATELNFNTVLFFVGKENSQALRQLPEKSKQKLKVDQHH